MRKRPSSPSARLGRPSAPSIVALEKRIAFDGAAAATAAKTIHAAPMDLAPHAADIARTSVPRDTLAAHRLAGTGAADAARALRGLDLGTGDLRAPSRPTAPKSVVFIESDVPDIATLIKDVDHSAQIVLLDAGKDGVDAIASYLAAHEGVQDVYIFSHGSQAQLDLGTARLDASSMQGRYAGDLATIKAALAPGANILVYGCDFAEGTTGDAAARLLSQLTGAAVAASTDPTGGTAQGGDFVLEDRVGMIDAPDVLNARIAQDYVGLLAAAPTTIFANSGTGAFHGNIEFLTFANTSLVSGGITNGATATYTTAEGSTVKVAFSNVSNASDAATFKPAALNAYAPSKLNSGYNNTASSSIMLYGSYKDTASFTVTFTATDKDGKSYTPNIAFADGEVTESSGESYTVTTNGGNFQNVETIGSTGYSLTGTDTPSVTLKNTSGGVPLLVTEHATSLKVTVQIAGGKEGFVLALVDPTLSLDANASSGAPANNYQTTFTEKGPAVAIADTDTSAVEPGTSTASSAKIVLTNAQAGDVLALSGALPSGITSSTDTSVAGQITVTLSGASTLTAYQTAIEDVTFANISSNPSTVDRTINVTYNDGSQDSNTAVSTVHVTAVNDPPVETVPGAQTTNKDTSLSITGMSVSDVDANGAAETTTLSVSNGTISLASIAGLTFSKGTGTNDTAETFTGTLSAINNAIATIKYQPTTGYYGSDTLNFSTDDNGNTGTGNAMTTSNSLEITVNNVNPTANGTIKDQNYWDGTANVSIPTSQAFSDSLGLTLTYSATGLPKGLTINETTGQITGTIDHDASATAPVKSGSGATLDGTYTVVETASDGQGGSTTQTFTIDSKNQPPAVGTATANQSNYDGDTIPAIDAAAAFSDPNGDPLTYTATGLPSGLSISSAGSITGTVGKSDQPRDYPIVVTATDDKNAATTESFTWTIADVPPATNGTLANQSVNDGRSGVSIATSQGFTDANGNALTYSASGLPAGLSIDATTGQITGTVDHDASAKAPSHTGSGATLDGKYPVTVTASDRLGGTATQSFSIDSTNSPPAVGTATANQSNYDGDTIPAIDAATAFSDPNGDPLTYTATGLPSGLSISSAGSITGTVGKSDQPRDYPIVVTATDDKNAATTERFTWTIADVPPTTNGTLANKSFNDGRSGVSIATSQGFTDANGNALTYSASGLPAGLSIDATTGQITGTVDHDASANAPSHTGSGATLDGKYPVTVTASDRLGGTATQSFSIDSTNSPPAVGTATANQSNYDGDTIPAIDAATAFSDPNGDPLTYTATGLPSGLSISSAGSITGTVGKSDQPRDYPIVVTATDDKNAATTESFTWTIADVPPTTNGTLANKSFNDGRSGVSIATSQGFTDANGNALTYSASGLPAGLSIDATTGQITGTVDHDASANAPSHTGSGATLDGKYSVTVTASDGLGGTATQSFSIDSTNGAPVIGTATANQANTTGDTIAPVDASKAFSDPNGDPLTYTATNLPTGLTIDPATGVISGTVAVNAKPGSYAVGVLATDDKSASTREALTWTITDTPPTASGSLANVSYADATANISIATAGAFTSPNGLALSYATSGLPSGLSIDASSGTITGQLGHDASKSAPATSGAGATLDGTYTVTVTASDGQGGTAKQVFKLDATNNAPALIAQTPDQTGADGQTVSLDGAKPFRDPNTGDTFTYAASGLPTGLTIDPHSGFVSGTIDPHASRSGPFTATVTITDDKGAATSESFQWGVADVAPVATPVLPDRSVNDGGTLSLATAGGFTNPNKVAYIYTATGLPKGLAIDSGTGVISGTIDHDASAGGSGGTYAIAVTADDGQGGTATNSFHLTSSNQAPVVGTRTADQTTAEGAAVAGVDASKAFADPNTGDTVTFSASNLPQGLAIDPDTGMISGTVPGNATPGAYLVTVTATDDKGAATPETFNWSIDDVPPVAKGTLPNQTFHDSMTGIAIGTAGGFSDAVSNALLYAATGLPAGLSIDQRTGQITGTLDHDASANGLTESGSGATLDGTYQVVVTARDSLGGSASQAFTIDAKNDVPVTGTTTPVQTNTEGDAVSINTGIVFSDPNLGDVLTYTATNLPPGLAIDPKSGLISGKVAGGDYSSSPYQVMVTATDEKGASAAETFSFVTLPPPVMAVSVVPNFSGFDGSAASIDTAGHFAGSSDATTMYSASGLPVGLSINAATGLISGTIDHDASRHGQTESGAGATLDGKYNVTVTAKNAGGAASQTFVLDAANEAPVVGSKTADQTSATGQTIATLDASRAFTDPNGDPLTYATTGLPAGLAIDTATGKITGTVSAAAPGRYSVSVTATDDKGAATVETFAWIVNDTPPIANGTVATKSFADSTANIQIATASVFTSPNGLPLTYRATGLPSGLSIDPASGIITGQLDHDASASARVTSGSGATLVGTYTVTVSADDGQGGIAIQTFTIDAANSAPALVRKTGDQHGQDGQAVSLDIAQAFADPNVGDRLTYAASNLPQGLAIDPATGLVSGAIADTASKAGPYSVTVTATDDKGAATSEIFTWAVDDLAPQATPPLGDRSVNDGTAISYATSGGFTNPNNLALAYSASGLPGGLSIDPASGLISGMMNHDASALIAGGRYTVAVTVDDGQGGTATNTFHLTASNQAPAVVMPLDAQSSHGGDTISGLAASQAFADPNVGDTLTYAASNLPKGLAIDPTSGVISGTVAGDAAAGAYTVTVTATDDKNAAVPTTFTWFIGDVPPTASGTLPGQPLTDGQSGIDIATAGGFASPNGLPLTYTATGLPLGLSIDPATGSITGHIGHDASLDAPARSGSGATLDGTYTIIVTADDGQGGRATQTFTVDASNQAPAIVAQTADQHAANGQPVALDASEAFADPNAGDTLTYAASGLPAGLTIDPASGRITGTIDPRASASGPYAVAVTATDDKGAATTETFRFIVADVPPTAGAPVAAASAADGTAIAPIDTGAHFASPNGLPLTYTAIGLPAGLAIDPATGRITGTLDHDASKNAPATSGSGATLDGTYTVTVTASDGQGGVATQTFTVDASNAAPAIVAQTADQHAANGQQVALDASEAFADPNAGDTLTYAASGLPAGLTIDPASGRITGSIDPRASASGPYAVAVTAIDDKGAATTETFRFIVADVPPTATAFAGQVAGDGATVHIATAGAFKSPNGVALRYAATGLPAGLAIDPATGVISGTLDHDASIGNGSGAGLYTIAVSASDGQGGSATSILRLTATNQAPAVGTRTVDQSGVDGATIAPVETSKAFADANGDPLTYTAANLPAGLAIDPATGRISGAVAGNAQPGTYRVAVTATDDKGAATTETFAWTIADAPPTAQGTLPSRNLADGQRDVAIATAGGFADANGNALTYAATGLPAGLAIDPRTGAITGSLDRGASTAGNHGTYVVTVTASDGLGGTAIQSLTIATANQPPVVGTATAAQHGQDGQAVSVDTATAFAEPNGDPLTYGAAGLPPGLSIDPATGRITGTLASTASASGPYAVTVTATDDKGAATSETFAWTIADVPPTATAPIDVGPVPDGTTIAPFDAYASFSNPSSQPLTYAASGLPAGLAIDPATGIVTGTLDHEASAGGVHGTYSVTVTASDGQGGTASQVFTLEATNQAPVLIAQTPDQAGDQGQQVAPVDASRAFADANAGDVVTYAANGLPRGLAIDPATGLIDGTIAPDAAPGDYAVIVSAVDDKGAATAETFHWSVGEVPPISRSLASRHYDDGQTGIAIDTAGGFASPNGLPLTYDAGGLPAGLAIDPATGRITGTLDRNASSLAPVKLGSGATLEGIYAVTITATDPFGGTTSQVFAIEVGNVPPAIGAQTPDQHGRAGQAIAPLDLGAAFVDAAGDRLTFAVTGLPSGLAFDPATGRVTGIIDPSLASAQVDTVTVTATDEKGASATESFLYKVDAVAPSILPPPSFFEPSAALLPAILGAATVRVADLGSHRSVEPATPVLDAINQTSGDEESSRVIALDGIVVSTVNGIAPLNGLQRLSEPGTGIVRSGAATDERGDRFDRTQNGVGRGVEALSTPSNFLGATSIDVEAAARSDAAAINIETMLRDRVLSISIGSGARLGDPLARVAVTLADGRPLPAWLRVEGKGYVVGKVPGGVESLDIKITSTFASGVTSQRSVTIRTDRGTIIPLAPRPQAGRTLSHMVAATRSAPADLSRIARLLE